MAQWMIKLAGDGFDLMTLSKLYTAPEFLVAKDEDGAYYLTSEAFDSEADAGRVDGAARAQLALINSLMKLRNLEFQPVSVDDIYRVNEDGTRQRYVLLSGVSEGKGGAFAELTVTGPGGLPIPSPEPAIAQSRLKLAQHNSLVGEALTFWSGCQPGDAGYWFNANKVYETIRADMGKGEKGRGKEEITRRGWATPAEITSFGEAANNPTITGNTARHGVGWETPSGITPMNEGEALAFIQRLLNQWLVWKIAQAT